MYLSPGYFSMIQGRKYDTIVNIFKFKSMIYLDSVGELNLLIATCTADRKREVSQID